VGAAVPSGGLAPSEKIAGDIALQKPALGLPPRPTPTEETVPLGW
jgi:hypothetical protein